MPRAENRWHANREVALRSSIASPSPGSLVARWWLAIRPHSLGTALAPVIVGGGLAIRDGNARPLALLLACLGVASLLAGVNLGNDYFDYRQGADPPIGQGNRALQRGLLAPRWFLIGSFVAFAVGAACGVLVVIESPRSVLLLGVAGALLGYFYTAPPFRLGYRGLGEIIVFLTLGEGAVLGSYVVTAAHWSRLPLLAGLPISFTVTAILHANNLRDLNEDRRSGKRTLAVRLGLEAGRWEFRILIGAALASILVLGVAITPLALLGFLAIPWTWQTLGEVDLQPLDGRKLMRLTSGLHVRLALLLGIGLAVSGVVGR